MVRIVRLKSPDSLEDALSVVLEEVNFHEQYTMRNRINNGQASGSKPPTTSGLGFKFGITPQMTQQPTGFKQFLPQQNNFKFGIPQNIRPQLGQQNFGFRPQLGVPQQQAPNRFPQFGYKPSHFGNTPQPTQFGYKPPRFGNAPQYMHPSQFGYKPPQVQKPHFQDTDVTMRTARPHVPGFKVNELSADADDVTHYDDPYGQYYYPDCEYMYDVYEPNEVETQANTTETETDRPDVQNFPIEASPQNPK